jgi:Domain of Unknown Function (DUF928)
MAPHNSPYQSLHMKVTQSFIASRWIARASIVLAASLLSLNSGLAQAVTFQPTGTRTPTKSTGGASRGMNFIPSGAPKTSTGGASRGGILFKPTGRTVRTATGGASRGTLFKSDRRRVLRAAGGASRGNLFSSSSAPKGPAGGASRDTSAVNNPGTSFPANLMALVPQEFNGNTLASHPTLMVFMPESNAEEAVFSLKDEDGNLIYQTVLPISGEAGIAKIQIPSSVPALEVGKNYQWLTALITEGRLTPSTPYVDGWIQRIAATPEMAKALQIKDPIARAQSLANQGIWYDTAATLVELREAQPENAASLKNWQELLVSVGLKEIESAPLLQYQ